MTKFKKILFKLLLEDISNTPKGKRLINAIKNRHPVSFYYNGPKGDVLPGRRIKAELYAMGLSKRGNLVVRAWVQPPSVSKKGFSEHGWRLFKINNMSGIHIYEEEIFNTKRPNYNDSGDKSLTKIYAKSDWGGIKIPPEKEILKPLKPTTKPLKLPPVKEPEELPQPKQIEKPPIIPQKTYNRDVETYDQIKDKIVTVNNQKQLSTDDMKLGIETLYRQKIDDWITYQKSIGGNTTPGEGTRRKLEKDAEVELFNILKNNNVVISNEQTPLQETIKRIKALILF